jgi:hypothetical protein
MATTRWSRRSTFATAGFTLALVAGAAAWSASSADPTPPSLPFWAAISGVASEKSPPTSVDDLAQRSDAIVLAHVTDVTDGRELTGIFDPTPPVIGSVPLPRTVFVELSIDRAVAGPVVSGTTLRLEMAAPPSPLTVETLRSQMPTGPLLFFLFSSAVQAKNSPYWTPVVEERERDIWTPASFKGVLAEGPDGLYEALRPDDPETTFLQSFQASTLDEAATRAAQALG